MNNKEIQLQLNGVSESKAEQIQKTFEPMVEGLKGFEKAFNLVMSEDPSQENCKTAKRLRLDIAKVRTSADKARKEMKEEYLRAGNAIQGVYNILKFAVVEKENKLKERELYFERMEELRIRNLQREREDIISQFEIDGSVLKLGEMPDDVWDSYLSGSRANYEAVKKAEEEARIKAQKEERLNAQYRERLQELSPYSFYCDTKSLKKESTLEEFNALLRIGKNEYKKQLEEKRKAEEARIKAEEEARLVREKAEKERIEREKEAEKQRKIQEAKEAELKRKAEEARIKAENLKRQQEKKEEEERLAREKKENAPEIEKARAIIRSLEEEKSRFRNKDILKAINDSISLIESAIIFL